MPTNFGIQTQPGGRFTAGTSTLKQLIAEAFEVKDYQIDGGPPWLTTDYFDITANAGADATPADVKAMLRTLLAERFGLRTRSDTRQAPVYVLTSRAERWTTGVAIDARDAGMRPADRTTAERHRTASATPQTSEADSVNSVTACSRSSSVWLPAIRR